MNRGLLRLVLAVSVFFCIQGSAKEKVILDKPQVDKRVELLSLVFRLAEKPEYSSTQFKLYTDKIDNYFGKYRNHELIEFTKSVMYKNGIGYDAVMSMAIHLDENLNGLKNVTDNSLDARWVKENIVQFIRLLKQFCADTKYDTFFADNKKLYTDISDRFHPVYAQIDLDWYKKFYGKEPKEKFHIINALANGGSNYGMSLNHANGQKEVYAIMGVWTVDNTGMPEFKVDEYFPILLHEFNHSFVNYLTEQNKEAFRKSGEELYRTIKDKMQKQAYGSWEIMMSEALVRASVIKYMKDHRLGEALIEKEINDQVNMGFFWIKELVGELEKYDKQRNLYPTLEKYIPELAKAYESYPTLLTLQSDDKRPQVIAIDEFTNGDKTVSADLKTITINFDRPLLGKGYSVNYGSKGKGAFPPIEGINYTNGNQSVKMVVKLEKGKEYQFILSGKHFVSKDGIGMNDYEVNFQTEK